MNSRPAAARREAERGRGPGAAHDAEGADGAEERGGGGEEALVVGADGGVEQRAELRLRRRGNAGSPQGLRV